MAGMIDIKTDEDDDLVFENGDLVLIDGSESCAQLIRARLQTIRGELRWDTRVGIPYDEMLGDTDIDLPRIQAWIRFAISSTPGVSSVSELEFEFTASTRVLTFDGEAIYTDGTPIPLKETLLIEVT